MPLEIQASNPATAHQNNEANNTNTSTAVKCVKMLASALKGTVALSPVAGILGFAGLGIASAATGTSVKAMLASVTSCANVNWGAIGSALGSAVGPALTIVTAGFNNVSGAKSTYKAHQELKKFTKGDLGQEWKNYKANPPTQATDKLRFQQLNQHRNDLLALRRISALQTAIGAGSLAIYGAALASAIAWAPAEFALSAANGIAAVVFTNKNANLQVSLAEQLASLNATAGAPTEVPPAAEAEEASNGGEGNVGAEGSNDAAGANIAGDSNTPPEATRENRRNGARQPDVSVAAA